MKLKAFRLKRAPKLVRALGTPGRHDAAFRELMMMGNKAVALFIEVLATPSGTMSGSSMEPWDGDMAHRHAVDGLARLKACEAVAPLVGLLESRDYAMKRKAIWALGQNRGRERGVSTDSIAGRSQRTHLCRVRIDTFGRGNPDGSTQRRSARRSRCAY